MSNLSSSPPKEGARVELVGLVKKPELNGCRGVVIKSYNQETGRCGVRLDDDGTGVNVKLSNITFVTAEKELQLTLMKLEQVGGTEEDPDDNDDDDNNNKNHTDPEYYLDELLAVGDARYNLEQYDKAGSIYYRAYYITMHKGNCINNPETFPVAHKMIQSWSKSNTEHYLKKGHGMAQQTLMMPGCPNYIRKDKITIEQAMVQKGIPVENIMDNLRNNMINIPNNDIINITNNEDTDIDIASFECVDESRVRHCIEPSASLDTIQRIINEAGVDDVIELPSGTFGTETPGTLEITKNLQLRGQGMDQTIIKCNLVVKQDRCSGGKVMVQKLKVQGVVTVSDNTFDDVTFFSMEVNATKLKADAVTINCCKKLLIFCCEIIGGSDGLCLIDRSTNARIDQTDIQLAASRGIFANTNFKIKDSAVYSCGSYGIKGRVGWTDLGGNELQPGPWSQFGPY